MVADFNLDGRPDIAAIPTSGTQSPVNVFLGNGAGGFVPFMGSATPNSAVALVTGDFNNDGRPDLAAAGGASPGTVTILLGDGSGRFAARSPVAAGPYPRGLATGDLNGDGNLDLAVANPSTPTAG